MKDKTLLIKQLDRKIAAFNSIDPEEFSSFQWIRSIRKAIGMSLMQLADRMSITKQSVNEIEKREATGALTIKSLREIAAAFDMQFVYGFIPNDGTIEKMIEHRAREIATEIVQRTSRTMALEDQENSSTRIEASIEEMTDKLKKEMPKHLWD
jgi:predicted DNA-binding mobile mystery protein A